jgi:hypothetical protein
MLYIILSAEKYGRTTAESGNMWVSACDKDGDLRQRRDPLHLPERTPRGSMTALFKMQAEIWSSAPQDTPDKNLVIIATGQD